jgi:hypothetical protein
MLKTVIHELWYAQAAIQIFLVVVVLARKMWTRFPSFSAYVLFNLAATLIKHTIQQSGALYFYTYWICEALAIVLGLAVVREIFMSLFAPHPALRKLATVIFRSAICLLIAMGCMVVYLQTPITQGLAKAVLTGEEGTRIVEVGLIMFLFLSSSAFGLHWRQNVFGIALGLGIFNASELMVLAIQLHNSSRETFQIIAIARVLAFSVSLLVWLAYLLAPERVTSSAEVPKRAQLEQWNQAITELISR